MNSSTVMELLIWEKSMNNLSLIVFKRSLVRVGLRLGLGLALGCALSTVYAGLPDFADTFSVRGELRMGLYSGSPTSVITNPANSEKVGVGYELGREFAKVLQLKYVPIIYPKNADVFYAAKEASIDLVFTNASPERSQVLQFSKPVVRIERGYLVSSLGPIQSVSQLDQPGMRVGVSVGSSSELELTHLLKNAVVVRTNSTASAIDMLRNGQLDAFSTNKGILFEMSDQWEHSKVLDEVLGYESIALGLPKSRVVDMDFVNNFVDELKRSGELSKIIKRAGLRGVAQDK